MRTTRRFMERVRSFTRRAASDLLHATLPSDCRICDAPMLGLSPVRVCETCIGRVRTQAAETEALCTRCGDALGMESVRFAASMGSRECSSCRVTPPAFSRVVAFGAYDHEMRAMLQALKFGRVRRVADHVLGSWMAETILQLESDAARELIVVPVPLFRARERSRGFNQAQLLAEAGIRRLQTLRPVWKLTLRPDALLRMRDTRALHALGPEQRRRSLAHAFRVGDAEAVRGREVLLIDDILTTGTTANACAGVLLAAGAIRVWVATVARARPESVRATVAEDVARWEAAPLTGAAP